MIHDLDKSLVNLVEQVLTESISVNGDELAAYCFVVAEEYTKMPEYDESQQWRWDKMVDHTSKVMPIVMSGVKVEYTEDDPYKNQKELMYDMVVNRRMKIYKSGEGSRHLGLKPEENDALRTVHDFFGHYSTNSKKFKEFLKANKIKDGQDTKLKDYRFSKGSFTVRGEMNTYITHSKLVPPDVAPALFTEIVGQICTYFTTGDYTSNKVGLVKGIDYKNIGFFTDGKLEARKKRYMEQLADPEVKVIKTGVGSVDKSKIRWNILSRGTGVTHAK